MDGHHLNDPSVLRAGNGKLGVDASSHADTGSVDIVQSDTDSLHVGTGDTGSLTCASFDVSSEAPQPLAAPKSLRGISSRGDDHADYESMDLTLLPASTVLLNVYDVGEEELVQKINAWGTMGDKFLFGGVFHVGVQIYGQEYGFGMVEEPGITGVCACAPRSNDQHKYKCTLDMGPTNMTEKEVDALLESLSHAPEWEGITYDLLHHNCLHFARSLCEKVDVRHMPHWLDRLGRTAAKVQIASEEATENWGKAKQVAQDTRRDLSEAWQNFRASVPGMRERFAEATTLFFAKACGSRANLEADEEERTRGRCGSGDLLAEAHGISLQNVMASDRRRSRGLRIKKPIVKLEISDQADAPASSSPDGRVMTDDFPCESTADDLPAKEEDSSRSTAQEAEPEKC